MLRTNLSSLVLSAVLGGCSFSKIDVDDTANGTTICVDYDEDGACQDLWCEGESCHQADCNDANPYVSPLSAEICNGIDDDCSGEVDEGLGGRNVGDDNDGDDYADPDSLITWSCEEWLPMGKAELSSENGPDCDDNNSSINPGAPEICDEIDNNCDADVDEAGNTMYRDADGDGYGDANDTISTCEPVAGYVTGHWDCDDTDSSIRPLADEICDGIDNNCDNDVDEGC